MLWKNDNKLGTHGPGQWNDIFPTQKLRFGWLNFNNQKFLFYDIFIKILNCTDFNNK